MNTRIPCFKCGRKLEAVCDNSDQPYGGTLFRTYGHYGSTFFDPMDGQYLELIICDPCLEDGSSNLLLSRDRRPVECNGVIVGYQQNLAKADKIHHETGREDRRERAEDKLVIRQSQLDTDIAGVVWNM